MNNSPEQTGREAAPAENGANTFEIVASYADGRHYVETTDAVLDAMIAAKEHLDQEKCNYVRIMRQMEQL